MTTTTTAAAAAHDISTKAIEAARAAYVARQDIDDLRARLRTAETNLAGYEAASAAAPHHYLNLLRALVNADETEPIESSRDNYTGRVVTFAGAMGNARASQTGRHTSKAPRWTAYGWDYDDPNRARSVDIFTPERGTRDADKLDAQRVEAIENAYRWAKAHTGAAWLAARGIEPVDPYGLVVATPHVRRDGSYPGALHVSLSFYAWDDDDGMTIELRRLDGYDLRYGYGNDRVPVVAPEIMAEVARLALSDIPTTDLPAATETALPIETRIDLATSILDGATPSIVRAWLGTMRTRPDDDR